MTEKSIESDLLFARQPIFDGNNKLYGYELLYRNLHPDVAIFDDGNKATSELMVNYCGGILNDEDAPYVKIFINLTRKLLLSDYFFPLQPSRVVIEIVEDTKVDEKLVNKVKQLIKQGYEFALDDYDFSRDFDPLVPLVKYIKIDLEYISDVTLKDSVQELEQNILKDLPRKPILLAEKVEDKEKYEFCRDLGFELYQGYFLERPQLVYGKKISNSSETALQIVAQMQDPEISVEDLSNSISRDTKLSYQILKIINSPLCRLPKKVNSLKEAVVFLGLDQIKKWAVALVLAGNSKQSTELFRILLTRGRTCELYAISKKYEMPESFFTVGLFSSIDAVMLADKKWLIEKLDLAQEMNDALLKEEGIKGQVLKWVLAVEHVDWSATNEMSTMDRIELFSAHENAINWAHKLCEVI
ncbi:EAL and HDOD domain-containing protein [Aliikangiella coralliicola]|uniref:HDOD domain-containing protein n=1 Tax=Aliikangiella coralliicola TaxID=2592383 RepID=A0A545UBK4_9GAMM|nr:HDOD domain-containing protein [Aliikangiella coralliicola]TQV86845.1 HDOD domain-containing protein [Aliikangiella coralliicola]